MTLEEIQLMVIKKVSEISEAVPQPSGKFFYYDDTGLLKKAPMTEIYNLVSGSQSLGTITTASTIPAEGNVWAFAAPGTYPNAGNLTVSPNTLGILTRVGGTWSKVEVELNVPNGKVEYGNTQAVSGDEVYKVLSRGIQTHKKEYDDAEITEFFSFVDEIYIIDSEQEQSISSYKLNYIWTNTNNLGQNIGKWGFQLTVNGSLNTNYGLPNNATIDDVVNGRFIEINANENEPLANRIKIFVKFKNYPNTAIFKQKEFSPFYTNAFIIKPFSQLIDIYLPQNTIHKTNTQDNKGLWFSLIKNIYINDVNYSEKDTYGINYIWLNSSLGKFGFQLLKNGGQHTNYTFLEPLEGNKKYLLETQGDGPLNNSVQVVVETSDFSQFPAISFLETLPEGIGKDIIINKNAFKIQKIGDVLKLFSKKTNNNEIIADIELNGNNAIQIAIDSVNNATKENPVTIRVKKGTYKALNSSDYTANGNYPAFIVPKDNVHIIGDSKEDCIVWAELPYDDAAIDRPIAREMHQTMYNWADNSVFENITFVGKNIRYVLHQDNPNETDKTRHYINCDWKFLGNKGYKTALGIGTYGGSKTYVYGGRSFSGHYYPVAIHNNQSFKNPSLWKFVGHTFSTLGSHCLAMQNSGSLISDQLYLENCVFEGGFKLKYEEVFIYTPDYNDSFNHANWQIKGFGNSPMFFDNNVLGKALKVTSSTNAGTVRFDVNSSAYPLIIANNKKYFGNLGHPERRIEDKYVVHDRYSSLPSYAIGAMSIQEDDYPYGTKTSQDRLGLRLGDCSVVNKVLGIIINGNTYNVVFNKNYTDFTNAQIIAEINAVIGGVGVASEYIIGRDYYPEFTDTTHVLTNQSSSAILKGDLVAIKTGGVSRATNGDIVFGIAIDDIEPSWQTGEGVVYGFGRVVKKMIFHTDQISKNSGVVIEKNKRYSALSGRLTENSNGNLIGFEDDYLLI